MIPTKQFS